MKSYSHPHKPASLQFALVRVAWMSLAIPTGLVTLDDPGTAAALTGTPSGEPTANEIYQAINEAEAQDVAVRSEARTAFD